MVAVDGAVWVPPHCEHHHGPRRGRDRHETLVLGAGCVVVGYGVFEPYAGFSTAALSRSVTLLVGSCLAAAVRAERLK